MISQRQKDGIQKIMGNLDQDTFAKADRTDPQVMAILNAVVGFPDQDSPHGVKATLQTFHRFITTDKPMEMLFH